MWLGESNHLFGSHMVEGEGKPSPTHLGGVALPPLRLAYHPAHLETVGTVHVSERHASPSHQRSPGPLVGHPPVRTDVFSRVSGPSRSLLCLDFGPRAVEPRRHSRIAVKRHKVIEMFVTERFQT